MNTSIPEFAHALVSRDERGVYTLQIHNAKSLNILSSEVTESLTEAVLWVGRQEDPRAVILRGSGERAFVGGANIHEMAGLEPESAKEFITRLRKLCDAVANMPVPTIARIPGFCLGAGMELAAACDIRLGSDDAVLGMPEVRVGIPSVIHAILLSAQIGPGATNWLLMTGETIDADQALRWGFLQFVSPPGELDALVERSISAIVASGPRAVRSQKALLQYWRVSGIEAGMDRSVEAFGAAFSTDEPRRYMEPFITRKRQQ